MDWKPLFKLIWQSEFSTLFLLRWINKASTNGAINYHAHQKFFLASFNIQFLKHTAFTCELQEQGTFLFCFSICHLQLFESVLWIFGWWNGNLIRNTRKTNQVSLNSAINFNTIIYFRLCMEQENILMAKFWLKFCYCHESFQWKKSY